jgi:SAM-dependent methyltransferase
MGVVERRRKCRELVHRYYSHVASRQDVLDREMADLLHSSAVLLDAGCGADLPLVARYGPKVSVAIGVDLCHPRVRPLARAYPVVGDLGSIPLRGESVDVVVSRSVVEHLRQPVPVFREIYRVLRPGGRFVFTTPNKLYYACLIALLVPEVLKARYFRVVFGADAYDHFPVQYRANTRRALERAARATGFKLTKVEALPHYPYYLMFSPLLFRLGMLYDLAIEAWGLDSLQSTWLVVMEK